MQPLQLSTLAYCSYFLHSLCGAVLAILTLSPYPGLVACTARDVCSIAHSVILNPSLSAPVEHAHSVILNPSLMAPVELTIYFQKLKIKT